MGGYANPLTGSGWGSSPMGSTNPIQAPPNPGLSAGNRQGSYGNPSGFDNGTGSGEIHKNMALENILSAQMKNQLAPQWANLMGQYGGQAADYFKNLMNLGSPYYRQKQQEAFTQGVGQNQNAGAQAQQQLRSQGFGSTPSGANAAMLGGMAQQGAQNLSEQYLQNLFQNENLQALGAQGMQGMASMFNPTPLLGGTSLGTDWQSPSNFFQNFNSVTSGIGNMLTGGGNLAKGLQ